MRVKLRDGTFVTCEPRPLGQGGVGRVFRTTDGRSVVKLFHHPTAELEKALPLIIGDYRRIADGAEWCELYRWPDAIVVEPTLGVRMPLVADGFHELSWLIFLKALASRPPSWRSWRSRLAIAAAIASAVTRLHGSGLAHSDLSPRNIWVDPLTSRVTLIDIDGLVVPGAVPAQVLGTPEYIAPELLVKQARPSSTSDLHSLAVLIYQLLLYRHPLRGPRVCSPDPAQDDLIAFGPDGLFVDHPTDRSNRPVTEEWAGFWPTRILGPQLVEMFGRAFVTGLRSPGTRPPAGEWVHALTRLADRVVACSDKRCPERFFPLSDGVAPICPWCRAPLKLRKRTPVLHLYQGVGDHHYEPEPHWWIAGTEGRRIYPWHAAKGIAAATSMDGRAIAEVEHDNGVWRLRNHELAELRVIRDGREHRVIPAGDSVTLHDGLTLLLASPPRGRAIVVSRFDF